MLVPVPPLRGTVPPRLLADQDSRFVAVRGLDLHVKERGVGDRPVVLLHGFMANLLTWRHVMPHLAAGGHRVVAFDRPGFGLTSRPQPGDWRRADWPGGSPYSAAAQADLTVALLDELELREAVLVGHSAGGAIAALTALRHPRRVSGLALLDAAVFHGAGQSRLWPLLRLPQVDRVGPILVRVLVRETGRLLPLVASSVWQDPGRVAADDLAAYRRPLLADDWDRGLWQVILAAGLGDLPDRLSELRVPTLVLTGDHDRIVPASQSREIARRVPGAGLRTFPACGHVPQEERPDLLVAALTEFLAGLP